MEVCGASFDVDYSTEAVFAVTNPSEAVSS